MQLRNRKMDQETAIKLLEIYNESHGNPYKFIKVVDHDQDGMILLCGLTNGEKIEVGVYPDMVVPVP